MNKPQRAQREGFFDEADLQPKPLEPPRPLEVEAAKPAPVPALESQPQPEAKPPPEARPPPAEPERWPLVIELRHKKLKTPEEIIERLTLREPTAGDIAKAGGNPVRIEIIEIKMDGLAHFNIVIDDKKMMALISQLSGVLVMFIETMDPRDYNSVAYRLRRFFMPEQGLW